MKCLTELKKKSDGGKGEPMCMRKQDKAVSETSKETYLLKRGKVYCIKKYKSDNNVFWWWNSNKMNFSL